MEDFFKYEIACERNLLRGQQKFFADFDGALKRIHASTDATPAAATAVAVEALIAATPTDATVAAAAATPTVALKVANHSLEFIFFPKYEHIKLDFV